MLRIQKQDDRTNHTRIVTAELLGHGEDAGQFRTPHGLQQADVHDVPMSFSVEVSYAELGTPLLVFGGEEAL